MGLKIGASILFLIMWKLSRDNDVTNLMVKIEEGSVGVFLEAEARRFSASKFLTSKFSEKRGKPSWNFVLKKSLPRGNS